MAAGGYQNRGSADNSCHKATTAQPAEAFLQMGLLKDSHKFFVVTCQALASPILFTKAHGLLNQANPLLLRKNEAQIRTQPAHLQGKHTAAPTNAGH